MAPPPDASKPLAERVKIMASNLQFAWFSGHVVLLLCTLRYGLSYVTFNYFSRWARFSYRTAFIAAAGTYGIVVYKSIKARSRSGQRQPGGHLTLITDENVQYLVMALVWLSAYQVPLALLPFSVYSIFHVATYTRTNLIPTVYPAQAKSTSSLQDTIKKFVTQYYDPSMYLVAALEIGLWFRLLFGAFTFKRGTWILLLVYTIFFRSRYSQSAFVQNAFHGAASRVDALVANQGTHPIVRQAWTKLKEVVRQITDATDLRKYTGAQPVKKAQ